MSSAGSVFVRLIAEQGCREPVGALLLDKDFRGKQSHIHETKREKMEPHPLGGSFWFLLYYHAFLADRSAAAAALYFRRAICSQLASGGTKDGCDLIGLGMGSLGDPAAAETAALPRGFPADMWVVSEGVLPGGMAYDGKVFRLQIRHADHAWHVPGMHEKES